MAAAQKAREALKAQGYSRVSLDITDSMHTDTEFSQDNDLTVTGILTPVDGTFNNSVLMTRSRNSLADNQSGDEHMEYKTRLIVYGGDSDPKKVESIVKDYISLA